MRGRRGPWAAGWLALLVAALPAAADTGEVDASRFSVGVAPFEFRGPEGAPAPDFATLLADRIGTRGVRRIVGPSEFAGPPNAEPDAQTVQAWAKEKEVEAIVVGRTTRIGNQLSVDVRLREPLRGTVTGTYVAEVTHPDQVEGAVERLASQVLAGVADNRARFRAMRSGSRQRESRPSLMEKLRERAGSGSSFGFGDWDRNAPLSIRSDELVATESGGARSLLFERNVRVEQGNLSITAARLRAVYPANGNEPDRLEANGGVSLKQGPRSARCDQVTYDRIQASLVCTGGAVLTDGANKLTGQEIEIDLRSERVRVKGGANIYIVPETLEEYQREEGEGAPVPASPPAGPAEGTS